jgi:YVTN family beta-propeller protein
MPPGTSPMSVGVSPSGATAYVTLGGNSTDNTVAVMDTATNTVVGSITVGSRPNGIAVR